MSGIVRTRMAPSPTGEYHIGHIRTVLYDLALARQNNGQFIMRIEDTDRGRFVEGAMDRILDVVRDYGLTWDEGPRVGGPYGPYIQSERLDIYKKYAEELIEKGAAYYCFCTEERLTQMREQQRINKIAQTKYDKHCLKLTKEEIQANLDNSLPYVIRLNVIPGKVIKFKDIVYGEITINSDEIDDTVLLKSDGFPTYHLAVVVDDHLMNITHIMRGNDWIPSTPKHVILYDAFGWELPIYAHLPNLKELGAAKKLSKRFGPVSAREFLNEGYLPEALLNFLMFLGWNPGTEKEIYSLDEFIKDFDIHKIHKTDLVAFDRQKLLSVNGEYIRRMSVEELTNQLLRFNADLEKIPREELLKIVELSQTRINILKDFDDVAHHFFHDIPGWLLQDNEKNIAAELVNGLTDIKDWNKDDIFAAMKALLTGRNIKMKVLYQILTGKERGLPLPESLVILGKERTLDRLKTLLT